MSYSYPATERKRTIQDDTIVGLQGVVNASRADLAVKEEQHALSSQMTTIWLLIGAFICAYIALIYYDTIQNYGFFIDTINTAGLPCSGLLTALCLRYPFINYIFGCTQNDNVPAAMWYLVHTRGLRQSAMIKYRTTNQDLAVAQALNAIYDAGLLDTTADAHSLACASVGSPLSADCAQQCALQTNFGGTSTGVAVAQGAMNGAGIGMGLMLVNPVVGAVAAGIGAVVGGIVGLFQHNDMSAQIISQCEAGRQNCYLPPNFPPCRDAPPP